ncbi:phosphotransferase [Amycolatopsis sp. lyj-109]|uniref:phosphotransferase n=1 Tax=Amycolatopsis sp. lyj-109 TaxID=2789287 RepID=UPI003979F3C1
MSEELRAAFEKHVATLSGEHVEELVDRSASVLAFTRTRVFKMFTREPLERTRRRHDWLARCGNLECRYHAAELASADRGILAMERLPGEKRLLDLFDANPFDLAQLDRVIARVTYLQSVSNAAPLPAALSGVELIENVGKQAALLRGDTLAALAERLLAVGRRLLSKPSGAGWRPVIHGDLHAANIFVLPERVVLIDPVFSERRARSAPGFTELASLYADALGLGLADVAERIERDFASRGGVASWPVFLLSVCLKALVRYRVAKSSPDTRAALADQADDEWCSSARRVADLVEVLLAELVVAGGPRR